MNQNEKLREAFDSYQERCQAAEECEIALGRAKNQVSKACANAVRAINAAGRENIPIIYNGWVYRVDEKGDLNVCKHEGVIL